MAEAKINADDLLKELEVVIARQGEATAALPKGQLHDGAKQLVHNTVGSLATIAKNIQLDTLEPAPQKMQVVRAMARHTLHNLANNLAAHLVDLRDEIVRSGGPNYGDDITFIAAGIKMVKQPGEFPELVEAVKKVSPMGFLCIDAAKVSHKVVAYAEQRLQRSGGEQQK